jgi:hypothetical protein
VVAAIAFKVADAQTLMARENIAELVVGVVPSVVK